MKLISFLGAIGLGIFTASWITSVQRRGNPNHTGGKRRKSDAVRGDGLSGFDLNNSGPRSGVVNINEASQQEIMTLLGLDAETADRIVEHRPYPSRIDLLGRMVVPNDIYETIKDKIVYRAS
jgi:DNA uptake protein ComE-like DNA-binding protein